MIYAYIHNYIGTCEHTLFFSYTRTYWSKSIEQTLVMTGNSAAPKTVAAVTATNVKRELHVWIEPKKRGLNVPSLYVLLEYDMRFVLFQYYTCCTLWNRACQDIHLSHTICRKRHARESCLSTFISRRWYCVAFPVFPVTYFHRVFAFYCANCRPYTLQTRKSIEFQTYCTLTTDCIFLSTVNTHKHIAHSLTGTFSVDVIIALINTIADSWAHWILWTIFQILFNTLPLTRHNRYWSKSFIPSVARGVHEKPRNWLMLQYAWVGGNSRQDEWACIQILISKPHHVAGSSSVCSVQ